MNYKMLLPSYRARYKSVMGILADLQKSGSISRDSIFLNLGCGEGDFDKHILGYFASGYGCDINQYDIQYCHRSAASLRLQYNVADAQRLPYRSETFDAIICLEVIEHVPDRATLIRESYRVLRPGGYGIFSFPRLSFPFLYDPVNSVLKLVGGKVCIGAYGYGHEELIKDREFSLWATESGYQILSEEKIGGELMGVCECYWAGLVQRLLKRNCRNNACAESSRTDVRPRGDAPDLVYLTDLVIAIDSIFLSWLPGSVNKICLLRKPNLI